MSTTQRIIDRGKKQIEKKKSITELDNETFKDCLNIVAHTQEGQYVLNRLMDNCGGLRSPFVQTKDGKLDTGTSEYRGGKQAVWLYELRKHLSVKNLKIILFLDRSKLCQNRKPIKAVKVKS